MVEEICRLVSDQFYPGILKLAVSTEDESWKRKRRRLSTVFSKPIEVVFVDDSARWRQRFMGEVREGSAEKAVEIYKKLSSEREELGSDIMILAPLHSQLRLIRQKARRAGTGTIPCSTIHKAQGQEYHTIILDVINLSGSNRFLTETLSKELINVAFSRAKARLIILANTDDLNSRYVNAAYTAQSPSNNHSGQYSEVAMEDLPDICNHTPITEQNIDNIKGKKLKLKLMNGEYTAITPSCIREKYLVAIHHPSGQEKSYALSIVNGR